MLGELVHFDRERNWWHAVRGELERTISSYRRELERWRQMHASVEANLASVRQELAQARAYSEHLRSAYQSSEDGRKFHAARGEQLKADIEALKARIAELESRAT
jgi:chromosome segregation ATPase